MKPLSEKTSCKCELCGRECKANFLVDRAVDRLKEGLKEEDYGSETTQIALNLIKEIFGEFK